MRLWCGKAKGCFHDFRDRNPSRAPRAEAARVLRAPGQTVATSATLPPSDATRRGGAGTTRAGSDGRDKHDPPAVGRHAPRRRGYFARRVRRSRQTRPARRRTPRAEAARVLRAPGQTVATSATLPLVDATRRGRAMRSTRWRSGETSWDCRTERSDVRRGPRRAPRPPPSPASHRARCAADQIERRGVAVKEASATGPVVLTVMRRFARSGNAERNGAARRPSGEKASKPTRST